MHDILIALVFVAMVAAPAVITSHKQFHATTASTWVAQFATSSNPSSLPQRYPDHPIQTVSCDVARITPSP
jgi:hypothetical protein